MGSDGLTPTGSWGAGGSGGGPGCARWNEALGLAKKKTGQPLITQMDKHPRDKRAHVEVRPEERELMSHDSSSPGGFSDATGHRDGFTQTGLSPADTAAALAAVDLIDQEPETTAAALGEM